MATRLPVAPTPFVGRRAELAEIRTLLADPACRLLTLTGPGGIGKTRLAIQAAAENEAAFADGACFVALQPVPSADYLVPALADAVGYAFYPGKESPRDQLLGHLRDKRLLLVLDNFEHLVGGSGLDLLPAILAAVPGCKMLVTSREVLGLQEEWIREVDGLAYPEDGRTARPADYAAVQLFDERARRVQADFSLERDGACAVRICYLVRGLPLALELAAAWLKTLPCAAVAGEIETSLDFLATRLHNVPERHRSVRAVFEQSWARLPAPEQEAFKRLAVFQGGFDRPAAQAVAGADLLVLQSLVDKSLVRLLPAGRYEVHELLRQFAAEQLAAHPDEQAETQDRHSAYYAAFLERHKDRLRSVDLQAACAAIDAEIDNVRAAWRRSAERCQEAEIRQSMGALLIYYQVRTRILEGAEMFDLAVERLQDGGDRFRGELYAHAGWFNACAARPENAVPLLDRAFALVSGGPVQRSTVMALAAMTFLGYTEMKPWDLAAVQAYHRASLERYEGADPWAAAWTAYSLGALASEQKDRAEAWRWLEVSVKHFRAAGDRWASTWALHHLGLVALDTARYAEARRIFQESLHICQEVSDQGGVAFSLAQLGDVSALEQEYDQSWHYLARAANTAHRAKRDLDAAWHAMRLAETLAEVGQAARAVEVMAFDLVYYPAQWHREYVEPRLQALQAVLPPDVFAHARRRGEAAKADEFFAALEAEFAGAKRPALGAAAPDQAALVEPLSRRELEVLGLVAAGLSNREIADRLVITIGAVKKHTNNIFGKLGVGSRTQAVARARVLGLLPPE